MFSRLLITAFLVLLLAGCATTTNTSDNQAQQLQNQVQQLQARVDSLEEELQSKDQEISCLEGELEKTQSMSISSQKKTKSSTTATLSIRQIQTALKNAGFYKGRIDGKLGRQTKNAIKQFQKAHGLKADGIVGKRTTAELSEYLTK